MEGFLPSPPPPGVRWLAITATRMHNSHESKPSKLQWNYVETFVLHSIIITIIIIIIIHMREIAHYSIVVIVITAAVVVYPSILLSGMNPPTTHHCGWAHRRPHPAVHR